MAIFVEEAQRHNREERENRRAAGYTGPVILPALVLLLLTLVIPASAIDTGASTTNPTIIVADYTVAPAVLLPGDTGTITLQIRNTAETATLKENTGITSGGTFANTKSTDINVFVENVHLEGNGIAVLTKDFDRLGELGPGQTLPVTFVIQAPERNGIYFPEAWIDVKDGRSTRYPLTVNVNTDISTQKRPALSVTRTLPDRVAPGDDCAVQVAIANTGLLRASDITVIANSSTKSLVLKTPGRYYVEHLDPGEQANLTLVLATDKNTPLGLDPVALAITYRTPDGTLAGQTEIIGVPVKGRAEIAVKSFSTDPVRPVPGSAFTLVVRVENTGTDKATSVRAVLDSPFTGTGSAFIGSIDKESDAPAVFYLVATKDGTVPVNLTVSYTDDFGTHAIAEEAAITTAPSAGLVPVIAVLALALLAGAAYWYLRIRPGKRNAA